MRMIDPDGLLRHAEQLADGREARLTDAALRRGISAAYYAVFHDLTRHAADHLVGSSCAREIQNEIRRSWSHGEISQLAEYVVERAITLTSLPPMLHYRDGSRKLGPLLDVVAKDAALVDSLQIVQRHAGTCGMRLTTTMRSEVRPSGISSRRVGTPDSREHGFVSDASSAAREALFTLLTVRRADFRQR